MGILCFRSVNLLHDCVKILGYHHSYNKELAEERNFVKALTEIQNVLNLWPMRGLSLLGRVQVLKALGISKIECISSMAYVPKKIIGELEKLKEKVLWKSSTVNIKHSTLIGDYKQGGIKNVDIEAN